MGATPLYLAIILARANAYSRASVTLRLSGTVCKELSDICSTKIPSMMRDTNKAVKRFSWETILREFESKLPTLVALVKLVLPHVSITNLCLVIGVIVKCRSPHMALIQRAVSVMLYANGANKQVRACDRLHIGTAVRVR